MFIPKAFDKTPNTVAFKPETFKRAPRLPWSFNNAANVYAYEVQAVWVSSIGGTRGSLVDGVATFVFRGNQYANLDFGAALAFGRTEKNPAAPYNHRVIRDVSYNAEVLVGNGNVWSGSDQNLEETLMFLLETYFALPKAPEGYTEWLTQKNKD